MPSPADHADEPEHQAMGVGFEDALNRHGYVFQHSLLVHINGLSAQRQCPWYVPVIEFPVASQDQSTRIDLILKHRRMELYLVAETKRANPALSNWCFAKSAQLPRGPLAHSSYFEAVTMDQGGHITSNLRELEPSERLYHLGMPVRTPERGDPTGQGRDAVEDACTQACRGLNGFINFLATHNPILSPGKTIGVMPAIFTTARLWVGDIDLGAGDLTTGELPPSGEPLEPFPWIFLLYNQSPGLKHQVPTGGRPTTLLDAQYQEYVRPIAVVGAGGIDDFLFSGIWQ